MKPIKIIFKDNDSKEILRSAEVSMFVVAVTGDDPIIECYVDKSNPLVVSADVANAGGDAPEEPQYVATAKMGDCTIAQYLDQGWTHEQLMANGLVEEVTDVEETEAVVEPAADPEYVATAKIGDYTIEQYHASGWTDEKLLAAGMIEVVAAEATPVPEEAAPAAPAEEVPPAVDPVLNAKANGATYQQFVEQGWTYETLVENGYIDVEPAAETETIAAAPAAPAAPAAETSEDGWPRKDGDNWVDSSGEVWNPDAHSTAKDPTLPPPVTTKGIFKKRRGGAKAAAAPAAPGAPIAPAAPQATDSAPAAPGAPAAPLADTTAPAAPGAPAAPPAGGDPELEDLIKDWGSA